jgi:opacity protein-like surface antigen
MALANTRTHISVRRVFVLASSALQALVLILQVASPALAQDAPAPLADARDSRTQYPLLLRNTYFSINIGYLDYPFTQQQLEPGFQADAIDIPPVGVRAVLIGHQFTKYLAVQAHYARPVQYVSYRNVNGDQAGHHVFMHFGGVTAKSQVALSSRVAAYGEAGIGVTSRSGFESGPTPVVRDAHFANLLLGGGVEYHVNRNWDLLGGALYSRGNAEQNQPRTVFTSGGFRYTMRERPAQVVEADRRSGYIFPEHMVQVSYTTDALGYGWNTLVSKRVPIFWGGNVRVARGFAVHYEQNVFHTGKVFGFDVGGSAGFWRSREQSEWFHTLSIYPLFRFTFLRTRPADVYFAYSLVGPTYISKSLLDGRATGNAFTFQDFMAFGVFVGPRRHVNLGVKINHYSNGNIQTENAGVKIPYTFNIGYTF